MACTTTQRLAPLVKAAAKEDVQLHWAAGFGRVEPVKVLVELGAGKEAKRDDRSTPLHDAAREGHVAAMRLLVVLGADMEAEDAREVTPLPLDCKIRARGGYPRAGGSGS